MPPINALFRLKTGFIPEILTFKQLVKLVYSYFYAILERQYLWKEAINHFAVFSPCSVILKGIGYGDKKMANSPFKVSRTVVKIEGEC